MRHLVLLIHTDGPPQHVRLAVQKLASLIAGAPDSEALLISDLPINRGDPLFAGSPPASFHLFQNDRPQGVGGNEKIGFRYAIERQFDTVSVVHTTSFGDGQALSDLWIEARSNASDGVLTVGKQNRCRDFILNRLAGVHFKGWFSPLRMYRVSALRQIAYELNANDGTFDAEVLLQLAKQGCAITAFPLPKSYAATWVRPSGLRLFKALKACAKYRLQQYNLFYDFRYHPQDVAAGPSRQEKYESKLDFDSPHRFVCRDPEAIPPGAKVLDLGSSSGYVARALSEEKHCHVTAIDQLPAAQVAAKGFDYFQFDLESEADRLCDFIAKQDFDVILMLDVLEHLTRPEVFLLKLYRIPYKKKPRYIFSTGNVSFFVVRLMLFLGYFNYGQKGILDITHKRLFSWRTFQNLFNQTGFVTLQKRCFPLPYRFLGFGPWLSRFCESLNNALIKLRPSLFAYQILLIAVPFDSPQQTLERLGQAAR